MVRVMIAVMVTRPRFGFDGAVGGGGGSSRSRCCRWGQPVTCGSYGGRRTRSRRLE